MAKKKQTTAMPTISEIESIFPPDSPTNSNDILKGLRVQVNTSRDGNRITTTVSLFLNGERISIDSDWVTIIE